MGKNEIRKNTYYCIFCGVIVSPMWRAFISAVRKERKNER